VSTAIPGTTSELLARVDEGWRAFRDAIRGLGRGRMDEPTGGGWTFRDLIAHVAAWEDITARRLRTFRESGGQTRPSEIADVDTFNAGVVASHRLVGAEALLDELDTAHRRLVAEIAQLTEEQMRHDVRETPFGPATWVVAIVAGNSYGHYEEHAAELAAARAVRREDMAERGLDGW
jgi:hypothetical protein